MCYVFYINNKENVFLCCSQQERHDNTMQYDLWALTTVVV